MNQLIIVCFHGKYEAATNINVNILSIIMTRLAKLSKIMMIMRVGVLFSFTTAITVLILTKRDTRTPSAMIKNITSPTRNQIERMFRIHPI